MSSQMPNSTTRLLLAALNAADEVIEGNSDFAGSLSVEKIPVARPLTGLSTMQSLDIADDRQNRFAATICLSMDKLKSASLRRVHSPVS